MNKTRNQIIAFIIVTVLLLAWPVTILCLYLTADINLIFDDEKAAIMTSVTMTLATVGVSNVFYFITFRTGLYGEKFKAVAIVKNVIFGIFAFAVPILSELIYFFDMTSAVTNFWLVGFVGAWIVSSAAVPLAYLLATEANNGEVYMPFIPIIVIPLSFGLCTAFGAIGLKVPVFYKLTIPVLSLGCLVGLIYRCFSDGMPFYAREEGEYAPARELDTESSKPKEPEPTDGEEKQKADPVEENPILQGMTKIAAKRRKHGGRLTVYACARSIFPDSPHRPLFRGSESIDGSMVVSFEGGSNYGIDVKDSSITIRGSVYFQYYDLDEEIAREGADLQSEFIDDYWAEEHEILDRAEAEFYSKLARLKNEYDDIDDDIPVRYNMETVIKKKGWYV